jgi:hypothetical protein
VKRNLFKLILGEYPWQVAILKKEQYDNVYVCGGSLIDGTHLLTAAHCVTQYRWAAREILYFADPGHFRVSWFQKDKY